MGENAQIQVIQNVKSNLQEEKNPNWISQTSICYNLWDEKRKWSTDIEIWATPELKIIDSDIEYFIKLIHDLSSLSEVTKIVFILT